MKTPPLACILSLSSLFLLPTHSWALECNLVDNQKIVAACFTGRAKGFALPYSGLFGLGGNLNVPWYQGPYSDEYQGPAFTPQGKGPNAATSSLPPYAWGAVGQLCDPAGDDQDAYKICVSSTKENLSDPIKNASFAKDQFYWKAHGHNCHDAAEDVGTCLLNAAALQPKECAFETKVIVWDTEPDIEKATGNVYHSQLLVHQIRTNPSSHEQEPVVCLQESQSASPGGVVLPECCSTRLDLLNGGTIQNYVSAFNNCPVLYFKDSDFHPHIYEVSKFREQRKTGMMDVINTYDRMAGVKSLSQIPTRSLGKRPAPPKIKGAKYNAQGLPIMLNIE